MNTKEAIERVRSRFNNWALDDEDLTALQVLGLIDADSEDDRIRKAISYAICAAAHEDGTLINNVTKDEALAYLEKQKEQQPLPPANSGARYYFDEWIKQQPIPKYWDAFLAGIDFNKKEQKPAEWSEKDEVAIKMAIIALEDIYDEHSPDDSYIGYDLPFNEAAKRLKALCPQPNTVSIKDATKFGNLEYERGVKDGLNQHWKPSKEQMSMLLAVINEPNNAGSESCHISLKSLYNDLEKQM